MCVSALNPIVVVEIHVQITGAWYAVQIHSTIAYNGHIQDFLEEAV